MMFNDCYWTLQNSVIIVLEPGHKLYRGVTERTDDCRYHLSGFRTNSVMISYLIMVDLRGGHKGITIIILLAVEICMCHGIISNSGQKLFLQSSRDLLAQLPGIGLFDSGNQFSMSHDSASVVGHSLPPQNLSVIFREQLKGSLLKVMR